MKNTPNQLELSPHLKKFVVELMQNQCILYQITIDLEDIVHEFNLAEIDAVNSWWSIARFCGIPPENLGCTKDEMAKGVCEHGNPATCDDWILSRMCEVKNFNDAEKLVDDMLEEGSTWAKEGACQECFTLVDGEYVFREISTCACHKKTQ